MKLQPTLTDVRALINNIREMLLPLASANNLEMVVDCEKAPEQVLTDPLRLQQILTNLLSNAIRYTEAGSIKLVCSCLADERWAIAITDTGIGIDAQDQVRIFEPYFRVVPPDQSYLPNSTGLGLAIVYRLVKLLQGKIELVSEIGVGSTFTVILPLEVKGSEDAAEGLTNQVES